MSQDQTDPSGSAFARWRIWAVRRRSRLKLIAITFVTCIPVGWLFSDLRHNQTALVGLIAGVFAWGQWNTARHKLVLDLFDKRYSRYQDLRSAAGSLESLGHDNLQAWLSFSRATFEMEYLFGEEVSYQMQALRDTGLKIRRLKRQLDGNNTVVGSPERDRAAEELYAALERHDQIVKDLYPILMPYLRMGQKLPRSPSEWPSQLSAWVNEKWRKE